MLRNKTNGPGRLSGDGNAAVPANGDCVRGSTQVRQAFSKESVVHPMGGQFYNSCSSKKSDAKLEKGLRRFRSIALLRVFSNWYTTVLVDMFNDAKMLSEWKRLHVGVER